MLQTLNTHFNYFFRNCAAISHISQLLQLQNRISLYSLVYHLKKKQFSLLATPIFRFFWDNKELGMLVLKTHLSLERLPFRYFYLELISCVIHFIKGTCFY